MCQGLANPHSFLTTADKLLRLRKPETADFYPLKNDRVSFTPDRGRDGRPYAHRIEILAPVRSVSLAGFFV